MGRRENPFLWYYNQNANFAELIDGWLYRGRGKIGSEQILDGDRRLLVRRGRKVYKDRFRDLYKHIEGVGLHLLIGVEHQSHIHYAMPVRAMDYDSASYVLQKEEISRRHEEAEDLEEDERLCGFAKSDRLMPVITLVLYYQEKPWDGAKSLYELLDMDKVPKKLRKYIADYPLHVLDICHTPDERLREFPPDIRTMFFTLKYKDEPEKLMEYLSQADAIRSDTCTAIADCIGEQRIKKFVKKEKGAKVNMASAIDILIANGEKRGEERGEKRGEERERKKTEYERERANRAEVRAQEAEARVRELEKLLGILS